MDRRAPFDLVNARLRLGVIKAGDPRTAGAGLRDLEEAERVNGRLATEDPASNRYRMLAVSIGLKIGEALGALGRTNAAIDRLEIERTHAHALTDGSFKQDSLLFLTLRLAELDARAGRADAPATRRRGGPSAHGETAEESLYRCPGPRRSRPSLCPSRQAQPRLRRSHSPRRQGRAQPRRRRGSLARSEAGQRVGTAPRERNRRSRSRPGGPQVAAPPPPLLKEMDPVSRLSRCSRMTGHSGGHHVCDYDWLPIHRCRVDCRTPRSRRPVAIGDRLQSAARSAQVRDGRARRRPDGSIEPGQPRDSDGNRDSARSLPGSPEVLRRGRQRAGGAASGPEARTGGLRRLRGQLRAGEWGGPDACRDSGRGRADWRRLRAAVQGHGGDFR